MRSRCVAVMALFTGPLLAQEEVAETTLDAAFAKVTHELLDLRAENRKVLALEDSTYLAVFGAEPLHILENGEWIDLDPPVVSEGEEGGPGPRPSGKALGVQEIDDYGGWLELPNNGGCVRKKADGTYSWFNNFRRLRKWTSTGDAYRVIYSYLTPIPDGYKPMPYSWLFTYQKTRSLSCGAEVRLLTGGVPGDAEQMWNWIATGTLIRDDPVIGYPEWYQWSPGDHGPRIVTQVLRGSVHLGIKDSPETTAGEDCAYGKWGTSEAPDWVWDSSVSEPNTYSLFAVLLQADWLSKPVAVEPQAWGHIKETAIASH